MNDWYLDPPEEEEPSQCLHCPDGYMDTPIGFVNLTDPLRADWMAVTCSVCGAVDYVAPEPDYLGIPDPEITDEEIDAIIAANKPAKCPHGNDWGECNACDIASDFAYDAARERK